MTPFETKRKNKSNKIKPGKLKNIERKRTREEAISITLRTSPVIKNKLFTKRRMAQNKK